ncbi:glycine, alanine and asparagine-rich protein isoform X1 [Hermetia illucens]|nr:glycine, alanine and asparagine-rich protein isoform X1 [Hermetia illucens]XP_037910500.1 glycine, alanine and asparagine-rich protein isoform X1 [Hermetia illucens]XP_037910501.1 glycine, alanine and asparagine-rich protein isoform X1 [Hermetia illucens]XP_037910502.1 glycine, alanine and asparagine-rich protein isoform X1 [Hermetia illucens]XP_037910503.1 glycine, alanine and asparagine-rich protein isoform X1 [Hermetia illucens]XP_037910504.1 glycine, alanine and asparagine-rich protein 
MKSFLLFLAVSIAFQSVMAEVNYRQVKTPDGGAYYGTFNSNGVSGGFGGGYSSGGLSGGYGGSSGGVPYGGVLSRGSFGGGSFPSDFESFITGQLSNLQNSYASGVSMIRATPGASVYASTSLTNNDNLYQDHLRQQQKFFDKLQQQAQFAASNPGANYAASSASYGPQGIHQTASVYPEDPNSPNVDTRFDADDGAGGKPGFFGVSSSSFFESSNVDGVEKHRKGAVTTVNDNGKVTTYKAGF